jgi:glycosidase
MLLTLLLTLRGTPYLYAGEEIGMTNPRFLSIDRYRDINTINAYRSLEQSGADAETLSTFLAHQMHTARDNGRTPMQWSAGTHGGFTSAPSPWIDLNPSYSSINVEAQVDDPQSIFSYARSLLELRKRHQALSEGSLRWAPFESLTSTLPPSLVCFERQHLTQRILVVLNFSTEPQQLSFSLPAQLILLSNTSHNSLTHLEGYGAMICLLQSEG